MELHNAQADFLFGFGLCFVPIGFVFVKVKFMKNGQSFIGELCFITHCSNIYIVQTSGKIWNAMQPRKKCNVALFKRR
jgi:hypothetical protein